MREYELYLNTHVEIKEAVIYIQPDFPAWRLKEIVDFTNLDQIILTGAITSKQANKMLEPLKLAHEYGKQRLPSEISFCSLKELKQKKAKIQALVFEGTSDITELYPFVELSPDYLLGEMPEQGLSSFALWEAFRGCADHFNIMTYRRDADAQVLTWDRNPDSNVELSIIFPMYNVAKYLDQCIKSVTAWKADYIEFLFVNDGSPDNSREIVLEWAKKDARIKLLDKPNGGCASARQWGLERARGRYIGFIDPDDFIDESMFRKLLRNAMVGSYEISYCGYKEYYENTGDTKEAVDVLGWPYNCGVTDPAKIRELIAYCRIAIWRGIYSAEMLKRAKIHFYTDLRRFDDLPFAIETYAAAKSIISLDEYLYYYRLARPGQDVSADDERLYVHFPIFSYLNDSVASVKNAQMTDYLLIRKIQTHRYSLEKIQKKFVKEYARQARQDLKTTGTFWRSLSVIKQGVGKRSAMYYWAIMTGNTAMLMWLKKG